MVSLLGWDARWFMGKMTGLNLAVKYSGNSTEWQVGTRGLATLVFTSPPRVLGPQRRGCSHQDCHSGLKRAARTPARWVRAGSVWRAHLARAQRGWEKGLEWIQGRVQQHRWKPELPEVRESNSAEVREARIISWIRVQSFTGTYHTSYVFLHNLCKYRYISLYSRFPKFTGLKIWDF